jgi:hypothetical protein
MLTALLGANASSSNDTCATSYAQVAINAHPLDRAWPFHQLLSAQRAANTTLAHMFHAISFTTLVPAELVLGRGYTARHITNIAQ